MVDGGFRLWGLGFGVCGSGLGFKVQALELGVQFLFTWSICLKAVFPKRGHVE